MANSVLRHDAPLYARVTDNLGTNTIGTLIFGGAASAFISAIWILAAWGSYSSDVSWVLFLWLGVSLLFSSAIIMMDNANCKRHIHATKNDLGKATAYYHLLNKDHQKMAKPVLDKMVELDSLPSCPRGEIRKRHDRIVDLYRKEQGQKVKSKTDDSDLIVLNVYLDDKTLNGGQ